MGSGSFDVNEFAAAVAKAEPRLAEKAAIVAALAGRAVHAEADLAAARQRVAEVEAQLERATLGLLALVKSAADENTKADARIAALEAQLAEMPAQVEAAYREAYRQSRVDGMLRQNDAESSWLASEARRRASDTAAEADPAPEGEGGGDG